MRSVLKSFVLIILVSFSGCTGNPEAILQKYLAAHNRHHVEKAMSCYAKDIRFELKGVWVKSGKPEIRSLEEWDAALNSNLKVKVLNESGDTLFCKVIEKNDWFRGVGMEEILHQSIMFVIKDGLISEVLGVPDPYAGEEIGHALASITEWSAMKNETKLDELMPDGEFIYSKENAEEWLLLLEQWNRDMKSVQ